MKAKQANLNRKSRYLVAQGAVAIGCLLTAGTVGYYLGKTSVRNGKLERFVLAPENVSVQVRRDAEGSFKVNVLIEDRNVLMSIDPNQRGVILSFEDAEAGIKLPQAHAFTEKIQLATGIVSAAPIRIERLAIGPIQMHHIGALVASLAAADGLITVYHTSVSASSGLSGNSYFSTTSRVGSLVAE